MKLKSIFAYLLVSSVFISSCEKEDPVIPNEEELITSVFLTLVPEGGGDEVLLSFQDFDGDGGDPPIIQGGQLKSGVKYNGILAFWNEAVFPEVEITPEIREEGDEHQVFYEPRINDKVSIEYVDQDVNGNPIGLLISLTATDPPARGDLVVTLKHLPMKPNSGIAADAGGETDIEVTFGISIAE